MAANPDILSKDMLTAMRAAMKSINPMAKNQEFQEILTKGISTGAIESLKKLSSKSPVGLGTAIPGLNGIGLIMAPKPMIDTAKNILLGLTGGKSGPAMEPIIIAIMSTIVLHFATNVQVESANGNGGQPPPPVGATPKSIEDAIKKALPPDLVKSMDDSLTKGGLVKSISAGIAVGLIAAVPGLIPFIPPPSGTAGPLEAIYK